jgi:hypothetical protein
MASPGFAAGGRYKSYTLYILHSVYPTLCPVYIRHSAQCTSYTVSSVQFGQCINPTPALPRPHRPAAVFYGLACRNWAESNIWSVAALVLPCGETLHRDGWWCIYQAFILYTLPRAEGGGGPVSSLRILVAQCCQASTLGSKSYVYRDTAS